MKSFAFDTWDGGRLTVNRDFAPLLERHELTTFESLMNFTGGRVAKNVLRERTTTRLDLPDVSGESRTLFLKRHVRPPFKEFIKPLLRFRRPIVGARNEWEAILQFHAAGIPTMVPVAFGQAVGPSLGCPSLLLTAGIEGCLKLTEWMTNWSTFPQSGGWRSLRPMIAAVADVASTMHAAGLCHQDFYLTHLMVPVEDAHRRSRARSPDSKIHVLDLGRVRKRPHLGHRWIIKDLAQLNYSASGVTASDRLRFLVRYLGRPIDESDCALVWRILAKTRAIARHSHKHRL